MISIARPQLGVEEAEAVLRVLNSGQLAQGMRVAAFERRFAEVCQVREAVAVSSGTDPDTYVIDPTLVEAAISSRTKAIMPVHLYGHPCDMERLAALAKAYGIAIVEDACQSHAAAINGRTVGSFGTGCFSFYATKNMTTGEGGMVTTHDPEVAERIRLFRSHGQKERYSHTTLGYNLRMTEMQSALGLIQTEKLEMFTERRIANAAFLTKRLGGSVQTPVVRSGCRHVFHQYTIRVPNNREEWMTRLRIRGIETAVHYPAGIHQQPLYRERIDKLRFVSSQKKTDTRQKTPDNYLPVKEKAAGQVLSLPVHPGLSEEDLSTIAREVLTLCD